MSSTLRFLCFKRIRCPQTAVVWKRLTHRNIVPLLGVTTDLLQLVSVGTSDKDLTGYVTMHPEVNALGLVGIQLVAVVEELTPLAVI